MAITLQLPPLHPLKALQQQLRGVSHYVLKSDIAAGRLKAAKIGGRWWITEEAIRSYLLLPADTCLTREIGAADVTVTSALDRAANSGVSE